jgi:hypothetical protein
VTERIDICYSSLQTEMPRRECQRRSKGVPKTSMAPWTKMLSLCSASLKGVFTAFWFLFSVCTTVRAQMRQCTTMIAYDQSCALLRIPILSSLEVVTLKILVVQTKRRKREYILCPFGLDLVQVPVCLSRTRDILLRRCFVVGNLLLRRHFVKETFCLERFCRGDFL